MKSHPHDAPTADLTKIHTTTRPGKAVAMNAKAQKVAKVTPKGNGGSTHSMKGTPKVKSGALPDQGLPSLGGKIPSKGLLSMKGC